jgi:hypothetical protein
MDGRRNSDGSGASAAECPELEIVHVNEAPGVLESSAYLLEFDSVHGRWHSGHVEVKDDAMVIDGKTVTYSMHTKVRGVQRRECRECRCAGRGIITQPWIRHARLSSCVGSSC